MKTILFNEMLHVCKRLHYINLINNGISSRDTVLLSSMEIATLNTDFSEAKRVSILCCDAPDSMVRESVLHYS